MCTVWGYLTGGYGFSQCTVWGYLTGGYGFSQCTVWGYLTGGYGFSQCTVWGYLTGGYGFSQCMWSRTHSLTRMSLLSRSSLVNSFSGSGGSGCLQPSTPAQSTSHLPLFPSPSPPSHSLTHSPQVIDKLIQDLAQLALDSINVVDLHSHLFLHLPQPYFLRGSI